MTDVSIGNVATMRPGSNAQGGLGRIDQYVLLRELGGGGFGSVYLAHDTEGNVDVAVKGLPPEVRVSREELENLRENFTLVSRLHHPHIAAALVMHPAREVTYADETVRQQLRIASGDPMLVMEYAPGVTLSSWRKSFPQKRVPMEAALQIVRQIASALDYAHERKVIHRDVKPANVVVETLPEGRPVARVLDFGLAAEVRSSMGRISREVRDTSGTRPYMAPEQWLGERQGAATDQYSLAVLFCELVSGEVPFQSLFDCGDPVVMLAAMTHRDPNVPAGVPRRQHRAVRKALSRNPACRHASCLAFVDALEGKGVASGGAIAWTVGALFVLAAGGYVAYPFLQTKSAVERPLPGETNRIVTVVAETNVPPSPSVLPVTNHEVSVDVPEIEPQPQPAPPETNREVSVEAPEIEPQPQPAPPETNREVSVEAPEIEPTALMDADKEAKRKADTEAKRKADEEAEAQKKRDDLLSRLAKGSEFVPSPPETAAGTERAVELPNGIRMQFVWCPPGRFLMGSPESELKRGNGERQHVVTLTKGFWLGKYEVTRDQWKVLMGRSRFAFTSLIGGDGEYPVDDVTWEQARAYCDLLSRHAGGRFRLPTEAEWEYACRAGTMTPFNFGSSLNGDKARCAGATEPYGTPEPGSNSYAGSSRVGSYLRSPWGLYDMHGNVYEWCSDYYAPYPEEDLTDPKGPTSGTVRVIRGGCWNYPPKMCRSAFRGQKHESLHDETVGFRVCCDEL